jgi:hypothetical protein
MTFTRRLLKHKYIILALNGVGNLPFGTMKKQ